MNLGADQDWLPPGRQLQIPASLTTGLPLSIAEATLREALRERYTLQCELGSAVAEWRRSGWWTTSGTTERSPSRARS
jgi:hypothetical protein